MDDDGGMAGAVGTHSGVGVKAGGGLARLLSPRRADVTLLTATSLLQFLANAATAVVATLVLSAGQRGVMVLGVSIGGVVALLAGTGTGSALRAALPSCPDRDGRDRLLAAYAWWTAAGALAAGVAAVGATRLSAPLIDPALSDTGLLVAIGLFAGVQVLLAQSTEAWFADGHYRRGGMAAVTTTAGGLVAVLGAAVVSDDAAVLLLAQGAGTAVGWCVQLRSLRLAGLLVTGRPVPRDVAHLVGKGAPALGLTLGLAVALRADRYVLGAVAGTAAVGVYSLAATVSEVSRLFPQAIGQLFLRDVALGGGRRRLFRWVVLSVVTTTVFGAAVVAIGGPLIEPLFGPQFAGAPRLLLLFVVAEVCFAPYAVASRGLLGGGWTRIAGAFGGAAVVVAITCYVLGARLGGSTGLAIGCAILYGGLSAASVWLFCLLTRRNTEGDRT
ncbi:MAG: hypothetical protein ABWY11_17605 [Umezawaea sp.]